MNGPEKFPAPKITPEHLDSTPQEPIKRLETAQEIEEAEANLQVEYEKARKRLDTAMRAEQYEAMRMERNKPIVEQAMRRLRIIENTVLSGALLSAVTYLGGVIAQEDTLIDIGGKATGASAAVLAIGLLSNLHARFSAKRWYEKFKKDKENNE